MNPGTAKLIINGVTKAGQKFRPSDWAQRLTTAVATIGAGRRIMFHPKVNMAMIEGINCVIIEADLEAEDPMLFAFLVNFATENNLKLTNHEGDDENHLPREAVNGS